MHCLISSLHSPWNTLWFYLVSGFWRVPIGLDQKIEKKVIGIDSGVNLELEVWIEVNRSWFVKYIRKKTGVMQWGIKYHLEKIPFIMLYQWWGDQRKPYRILLKSQYSLTWKSGLPMGGRITATSSSGSCVLQNAFFQFPCWRVCLLPTAFAVSGHRELYFKTGA